MSERRIPVLNWIEVTPPQPGKNYGRNLDTQITQIEDSHFAPGTIVELTCRPPKSTTNYNPHAKVLSMLEASKAILSIGLEPRIHVAARMFPPDLAKDLIEETSKLGINRVFLIAGDGKTPYSPDLTDSLELARLTLEVNPKIGIGFAAYPGLRHPFLSRQQLWDSMVEKTRLKQTHDVDITFHTQFDPSAKRNMQLAQVLERLDNCPLRIGLLGPTNFSTLIKVAEFAGFSPWELVKDKPDLVAGVLLSAVQQRLPIGSSITLPDWLNYRPDGLVKSVNDSKEQHGNISGFYIYSMNNFPGTKKLLDRLNPAPQPYTPIILG